MDTADIWTRSLLPSLLDMAVIGFYLILMFLVANHIRIRNQERNPAYRFYVWGLFAKVLGAVLMGLVYTLYYEGGDTTAYYISTEAILNVALRDLGMFLRIVLGEMSPETFSAFTGQTGWPLYWGKPGSFIVVQLAWPFTILGFGNYFTATILFAWFFYGGTWKMFLLATRLYPAHARSFSLGILFFPSVLFWASGISKDAITLAAVGWFVYSGYQVFVDRIKKPGALLMLVTSSALLLLVKPYVFVALVPGGFIWLAWSVLKKIGNPLLRIAAIPATTALFLGIALLFLEVFQPLLGEYGSLDSIIEQAIITHEDHAREELYGENYYYLGPFDGTAADFFSKTPAAIVAGLFRPFPWEVRSAFMAFAALENMFVMLLIGIILWRVGPIKVWKIAFEEPMAVFALSFAITFAFAVGISMANFGALMRLKTPLIPFLIVGLYILYHKAMEMKKERRE